MLILGIDPGLANTGWGVVDVSGQHFRPVSYGTVNTSPRENLENRIAEIATQIGEIAVKYSVQDVSIEDIYFAKNEVSAIGVAKVIGALCYSLYTKTIPVHLYTPLQIKQSVTGYGRADKNQVQEMTRMILHLDTIPRPDHAADALAAAVCHAHTSSTFGVFSRALK